MISIFVTLTLLVALQTCNIFVTCDIDSKRALQCLGDCAGNYDLCVQQANGFEERYIYCVVPNSLCKDRCEKKRQVSSLLRTLHKREADRKEEMESLSKKRHVKNDVRDLLDIL